MWYREIKQDLFQTEKEFVLAHCISADAALGAGIAKEFRRRYPMMPKAIAETQPKIGDVVVYEADDRIIFNLVTKEKYWHKPTDKTFEMAILSLKEEMVERNLMKLAIPQIGAGLDRLDWNKNKDVIQYAFLKTDITIDVCLWK